MKQLIDYSFREQYPNVEKLGYTLAEVESLINGEVFILIITGMYKNNTEKGGKPNINEIVMIKPLKFKE